MADPTMELLRELTEAKGIPGYEGQVRGIVRKHFESLGEISQDKIGSVICKAEGSFEAPKVMLAGHMDEIGFMVKHITKEGFIHFLPLGGWFDQVLLGQRVVINTRQGEVVGVIGAKPPHLLPADQRNKVVQRKEMFIDIGATSKEEVEEAGVRAGDPVIPRADFVLLANGNTYLSKAFDDRVGVALIVSSLEELKSNDHPNTIFGVATVQEEVGVRGATTSVRAVDPDVAIILEIDIAGDVPGIKPEESSVKLGKGPSMLIYDARMIPNIKLRNFLMDTAEEMEIPLQVSYFERGGTDGGAIHLHNTGVPTVVLTVPARHIHSDSSIIHRGDYDYAVQLLVEVLKRLDAEIVAEFTA
ncbi:MAG: M42 family metallopeptidase [Chloroflexota bacterium]|nr:MAG: M42 family metallopeptidase [Chloroflexota bacterium]